MEVTQTLAGVSRHPASIMPRGEIIGVRGGRWTHKRPNMKMPLSTDFCLMVMFNRHTIGNGRHKTIKSMSRLHIPFQRKKLIKSIHCPGIVLSKFFSNGWQSAKATMVHATQ